MEGRILVVHRNELILDVIQEMLQDVGYAVSLASDGHRALSLSEGQFDVPQVDFAAMARSLGAEGVRVETEDMLDGVFIEAQRCLKESQEPK